MLYGATRQAGLLAADLRSGARQGADRDRTRRTMDPVTAGGRPVEPAGTHRSILTDVRRHLRQAPAAHVTAR